MPYFTDSYKDFDHFAKCLILLVVTRAVPVTAIYCCYLQEFFFMRLFKIYFRLLRNMISQYLLSVMRIHCCMIRQMFTLFRYQSMLRPNVMFNVVICGLNWVFHILLNYF